MFSKIENRYQELTVLIYIYCAQGAKTLFPLQQKPCLAIEQVQTLFSRNGDLKVETDLTNFKVIKPEKNSNFKLKLYLYDHFFLSRVCKLHDNLCTQRNGYKTSILTHKKK